MKSNVIQLNLPGNKHQYDWLLAKIRQAENASRMYVASIKANANGPYDQTDLSREYGYQEFGGLVEMWIRDSYRGNV